MGFVGGFMTFWIIFAFYKKNLVTSAYMGSYQIGA